MSAPIQWASIENAIYDWFTQQTLISAIWANQDAPQPKYPFATLSFISGPTMEGALDEVLYRTDLAQQPGQEVELRVQGWRQFTLSCHVYQGPPNTHDPAQHARAILQRAQSSLGLPSVRDAFNAVNLAVVRQSDVEGLHDLSEDTWISHAVMDIIFRTTAVMAERTGYIDQISTTSTSLGITGTIG